MLAPITPRPIQPVRVAPGDARVTATAMPGLIAREAPKAREGAATPADRPRPSDSTGRSARYSTVRPTIRARRPRCHADGRRRRLARKLHCMRNSSASGSPVAIDRQAGRRTAMHRDLASNGTALWKGLGFALVLGIAACGGGGGGGSSAPPVGEETPPPPGPTATPRPDGECSQEFDGTFAGSQEVILERQGCTQDVCHGSSAQGGLKLTADVAYANIFNKKALSSPLNLIEPGDEEQSYLWLNLAASTKPDVYGDHITGAPMP